MASPLLRDTTQTMRGRDILVLLSCVALAVVLFYVAGLQLDHIDTQRREMGLVVDAALEEAPPSLVFATVAMGAFRGLVVDILWMRADKLKEEGQFFDARQLAEWITTLQPRFAEVWEFHAWNMAYNISVAIPASQPDQRWRWVRNGYELLRDKGIPMNPRSIQLYRELARIFQHKMGGVSDDAHKYYKLQMAAEIGPLLWSADNDLMPDDNAFFDALIRAPQSWEQVAHDPNMIPFIEELRAADEAFSSDEKFIPNYIMLRLNQQRFKPEAGEVIDRYRGTTELKQFDLFAKAHELRRIWKLDLPLVREVNQTYGPVDFRDPNTHLPFDWRHPDTHAIYWAVKGLKVAGEIGVEDYSAQETNTDRIVAHSLQNLFRHGKIMILQGRADPLPEEQGGTEPNMVRMRRDIFLGPDLRFFDSYNKALLAILDKYKGDRGRITTYQNGHRNMLKNAVLSFWMAGLKREALQIYNELRGRYPIPDFNVSLEQFVNNRFREEIESIGIDDAREQIIFLLMEGYRLYAIREDDAAAGREAMAQQVYDHYNKQNEPEFRIDLPSMRELRYFAFGQFFYSGVYPSYILDGLMRRIEVEKPKLFEELQQTDVEFRRRAEEPQKQP